ncbi:MAG TPA: SRPBCC family protein [Pseudonocardia sp.]|nr:SRPBCC family protein [Pseudonocardia sp.]
MRRLPPIDDAFLTEAPFILNASLTVPQSPEQVWQVCIGDELGSWVAMLDQARWHTPRPLGRGALRSVRLGRLVTILEEFYTWEEGRRQTFRVTEINLPVVRGWAEDIRLTPTSDGGTRLDYTIAIDNRLLRIVRVPRWLQPRLDAFATSMMVGISTVLPPVNAAHLNPPTP